MAYNKRLALGPGGVRAPRRQPAGPDRPHRQRPRLGLGGDRPAHHRAGRQPVRPRCDDIFYFNKGRLYANYLLLRELGSDFEGIIREKGLTNAWNGTVETFRIAAQLDPWVVWNGYPDAFLIPNHLAAQGFYLLRARTQLREISAILLK